MEMYYAVYNSIICNRIIYFFIIDLLSEFIYLSITGIPFSITKSVHQLTHLFILPSYFLIIQVWQELHWFYQI